MIGTRGWPSAGWGEAGAPLEQDRSQLHCSDQGRQAAGVAMAFKLIESAQARRRTVNAPHLVALVGAGAKFERGQLVEPRRIRR